MESDRIINTLQDGVSDGLQKMRPPHGRTTGPTRRSTKGQWTAEEDETLCKAVHRFKGKNWKKIAECFKDRTDVQCLHRWQKVLNPELVKGPWSKEEDEVIIELVDKYGAKKWSTIAQHLPGRIGKQCRERWHNHLNPAINKEAWTQEEELALIRAHQIYGNKWAELTKFLPGRTDNSIKNHWNSSVKKKLESYLASGLLSEFQGLPHVGHQNQIMPSSSSRMQQCSGDDSGPKDGTEAEDTSECSQGSTVVGCSQGTSDMTNTVLHTGRERLLTDDSSQGKEQRSSPASSSQRYYTSVEEVNFSIPEVPYEVGCPFLEQDFSHETGTSAHRDTQFNLHVFPNISSLELGQEGSDFSTHCVRSELKHEATPTSLQASVGINDSTIMGNVVMDSNQLEHMLISESDCCRVIFSEEETDGCTSSGNFQLYENDRFFASQAYYPVRTDILETSCCQSLSSVPLLLSADHSRSIYDSDLNRLHDISVGTQEHEFVARTHEDFILTNDSASFPCHDDNDTDKIFPQEQNQTTHSANLIPVDTFSSRPSDSVQICPINERSVAKIEQQDTGSLFYEPPRFPSLDIPFFSCDLIQSGSDMQQEYSPLGIRQLMMSSMNCLTPFRSWDSPSRDDSPDAVLKSAAKTFTGTPSILKKRHRDLLSPLSERRSDKKIGRDFNQRSLSSLARDFSHLDVMFDENATSPSSDQKRNSEACIEYKENLDIASKGGNVEGKDKTASSHVRTSEKEFDSSNSEDGTVGNDAKIQVAADGTDQIPSGVLVEHNVNNLQFFSPDRLGSKAERVPDLSTSSNQANSSGNPCIPIVTSPIVNGKKHEHMVAVTSMKAAPSSTPLKILVDNARHDAGIENVTLFGETPFKRSIGSPPAWLSPWFFNSFLPGPRVDTEITIEDIGYFLSPGDRSYDAIGLMKQLSEHTAAAFADAQEVLGNDTPQTVLKERRSNNQNQDRSHLSSDNLTERRMLDFSECGTPGKTKENGKSSNGLSLSSPSSYLMKSCR